MPMLSRCVSQKSSYYYHHNKALQKVRLYAEGLADYYRAMISARGVNLQCHRANATREAT